MKRLVRGRSEVTECREVESVLEAGGFIFVGVKHQGT